VPLRLDGRPRLLLRRGGRLKSPAKPIGYSRVKRVEGGHARQLNHRQGAATSPHLDTAALTRPGLRAYSAALMELLSC